MVLESGTKHSIIIVLLLRCMKMHRTAGGEERTWKLWFSPFIISFQKENVEKDV